VWRIGGFRVRGVYFSCVYVCVYIDKKMREALRDGWGEVKLRESCVVIVPRDVLCVAVVSLCGACTWTRGAT
jgi:hypothetical protein